MADQCISNFFRALPIHGEPANPTESFESIGHEYLGYTATDFVACGTALLKIQEDCDTFRKEVEPFILTLISMLIATQEISLSLSLATTALLKNMIGRFSRIIPGPAEVT